MRALKKIMAALALTAVLAGCSADNILSSIQGGKAGTVQTVSRPAVESAELQFTHPAAGDTIAVCSIPRQACSKQCSFPPRPRRPCRISRLWPSRAFTTA